jgi:DNA-binding transcriptional regulator YiaG
MENDMEWKGKYKSELLMVCHTGAQAMHDIGVISDKEMREYDRDCLVSSPKKSSESTSIPVKTIPVYAGSSCRS